MSIEEIEKKYSDFLEVDKEKSVEKLVSIIESLIRLIERSAGLEYLKEKLTKILNNILEKGMEITENEINKYLTEIKEVLEVLKGNRKREPAVEERELVEDLNVIQQILEEEIPKKKIVEEVKREVLTLEDIKRELKELREYVKILSDRLYEIGDELLEVKERLKKLEEREEKKVEIETKETYLLKNLIREARDALKTFNKNKISRAIVVEALKLKFEKSEENLKKVPEDLKKEFKRIYTELIDESKILRKKLLSGGE